MIRTLLLSLTAALAIASSAFTSSPLRSPASQNSSLESVTTYWLGNESEYAPEAPDVIESTHQYLTARTLDPKKSIIEERPYVIKANCYTDYGVTTLKVDTSKDPDIFQLLVPEGTPANRTVTGEGTFLGQSWNWHTMIAKFHAPQFYVEDVNDFSPNTIAGLKTNFKLDGTPNLISKAVLQKIDEATYKAMLEDALAKKSCFSLGR